MKKLAIVIIAISLFFPLKSSAGFKVETNGFFDKIPVTDRVNLIIELKDPPLSTYTKTLKYRIMSIFDRNELEDYEKTIVRDQEKITQTIKKYNGDITCTYNYIFNGISCSIDGKDSERLLEIGEIKGIYPDNVVYLEDDDYKEVIKSNIVKLMKDKNGNYLTGEGIIVGVIDTGVDYTNKELGGGTFPNAKVIGGYDFGDNDPDPMDEEGHGTHITGIIAGLDKGIATSAKIRAYKVFSKSDTQTSTSKIIQGIEQAAKDKCHIVNISIGTSGGYAEGSDPESIAVRNATLSGVTIIAAAGNRGARSEYEEYPISSPASVKEAIGVGASNDTLSGVITIKNTEIQGKYPAESPTFAEGIYELVYCGLGEKSDFENKDVKGKVAFIQRGKIYYGDKDLNAKEAGAVGVITYNHLSGLPEISLQSEENPDTKDFIPFLFISYTDGQFLLRNIKNSIKISNKSGLGMIAEFSANGPTIDMYLKPDIVAPGVDIESLYLNDSTINMSGTSVSSPVVAGCIAILKQAKPNLNPEKLKANLMNTADILINPDSQIPFSTLMQGAGRVNLFNAVRATSIVTPSSFAFTRKTTATFTLTNLSKSSISFYSGYKSYPSENITVSLPFLITVPADSSTTLEATFNIKEPALNSYGFINLTGGSENILHIPFAYIAKQEEQSFIENVKASNTEVSQGRPLEVSFTVTMGGELEDNTTKYRSNLAEEVKMNIYNTKGELVRTIFDQAPIYIGNYTVKFDPVDSTTGNYTIPKGEYLFKIQYLETNNDEETKDIMPILVKEEEYGSFIVSDAPQNIINLSIHEGLTPLLKKNKNIYVDINLVPAVSVDSIQLSLTYNYTHFKVLNVSEGSSHNENIIFNSNVSEGTVEISIRSIEGKLSFSSALASIQFEAVGDGEGFIEINSVNTMPPFKVAIENIYYKISDYATYFDLDKNKRVNGDDTAIFERSFGTIRGDNDFSSSCDFDFNGVINSLDFLILADHFGEEYP